jgi:hypothetical protein
MDVILPYSIEDCDLSTEISDYYNSYFGLENNIQYNAYNDTCPSPIHLIMNV